MSASAAPVSSPAPAAEPFRVRLSRYTIVHEEEAGLLLFNTRSGALVTLDGAEAELIHEARRGPVPLGRFRLSEDAELLSSFFVPEEADEVKPLESAWEREGTRRDELFLTLVTSAGCNFGCFYCFEKDKKERMLSAETAASIVRLVEQRLPLKRLTVDWFGGEPLLNLEGLLSLSAELQGLAARHGFTFASSMTSNGYLLTPEACERLVERGLRRVLVTFDGPRDYHDKVRRPKEGGSFDVTARNLRYAARKLKASMRVHLSPWNAGRMPELLHQLREHGLHEGTTLYFAPLHDMGTGAGHLAGRTLTPEKLAEVTLELTDQALALGFGVRFLAPLQSMGCNVLFDNQLLVDADGTVKNCYLDVGDPSQAKGTLQPDGGVARNPAYDDVWARYGPLETECRNCSYLPLCWGGCHWSALRGKPWEERCHPMKLHPERHLTALRRWLDQGCTFEPQTGVLRRRGA